MNIQIDIFVYRSDLETTILVSFPSKSLNYTVTNSSLQKLSTLTIAKFTISTRTDITLQTGVKYLTAIKMCRAFTLVVGITIGQNGLFFEESPKSIQCVVGYVFCPSQFCFNREKCHSLDGCVTTPWSVYGGGKCELWLFVHKIHFTLQEHVKTTKTVGTRFFFAEKNDEFVTRLTIVHYCPFQSTKYRLKEMGVDNKEQEASEEVYCPTCRNEKSVYLSTN